MAKQSISNEYNFPAPNKESINLSNVPSKIKQAVIFS